MDLGSIAQKVAAMDVRMATSLAQGPENVAAFCRSVGSSRTAFYEWRARFEAGGVKGLLDRSRRPVSTTGAFSPSSPAAGHEVELPCAKQLGGSRVRRLAFWPASVVNVSAMSVGSLSGPAIEALNRGASLAGCLQNIGRVASRRTTAMAVS